MLICSYLAQLFFVMQVGQILLLSKKVHRQWEPCAEISSGQAVPILVLVNVGTPLGPRAAEGWNVKNLKSWNKPAEIK